LPHDAAGIGARDQPRVVAKDGRFASAPGLTTDLSQRIARGAVPIDGALPITKQIAEALEAVHEQGIIHRDLKPASIKLRPYGTVKLLDFGLAKALAPEQEARRQLALRFLTW
jgi:serine/threonine protein kinase